MFKLIFRTITITLFSIVLIAGLAFWKGGEPFIWLGESTEAVGKVIVQFGEMVDDLKGKKDKVEKTYKEIKKTLDTGKKLLSEEGAGKGTKNEIKKENGTVTESKKP